MGLVVIGVDRVDPDQDRLVRGLEEQRLPRCYLTTRQPLVIRHVHAGVTASSAVDVDQIAVPLPRILQREPVTVKVSQTVSGVLTKPRLRQTSRLAVDGSTESSQKIHG
jgi:hypothetical protein